MGASFVEPHMDRQEKWNPELIKALSFGQWPLTVDWLWILALQDPALSHVSVGQRASIFYDFDLATDIDPAFIEAYVYGGNLLTVVRNDNEGARVLLEKGEKFREENLPKYPKNFREVTWKSSWWIPVTLGYVYLYELNDLPNASRAFHAAGEIPNSPEYVKSLGEKMKTRNGQYEIAIRLVDYFRSVNKDERVLEGFEKKRRDLILSQYLYNLNEQFVDYLKTIPEYRRSSLVARPKMTQYFGKFLKTRQVGSTDPFGGKIYLDEGDRINSSTPREKVFGLN